MRAIGDIKDGAVALHDPTVPTRPGGDASNAIATTGFVRRYFKGLQPPVVNEAPPATPCPGQFWWNTGTGPGGGQLYIWTGKQWVAASCCETGGGAEVAVSAEPPGPSPATGTLWFDTVNNQLKVWDGSAWMTAVPIVVPGGPSGAVQFNDAGAFGGSANITLDPAGLIQLASTTVASLPAPSSTLTGARATVTDALNSTGVVVGGGANIIPVFCDGTNWISGYGQPAGPNGAVQFNNVGAFGGSGNVTMDAAGRIQLTAVTVASLPTASPVLRGACATVIDATWPTGVVQGGGANIIPVFCNGGNWLANAGWSISGYIGGDSNWATTTRVRVEPFDGQLRTLGAWVASGNLDEGLLNPNPAVGQLWWRKYDRSLYATDGTSWQRVYGGNPRFVGELGAPTAALRGARATVIDALSRNYDDVVVGGGANIVPVWCDGTNWRIG